MCEKYKIVNFHKIPEFQNRATAVIIVLKNENNFFYLDSQDLKSGNVLLGTGNSSSEIKIADFDLSKQTHEDTFDSDDGMDLASKDK